MALALRYVAHSEIGLVRKNNQDSAYVSPTHADGGRRHGRRGGRRPGVSARGDRRSCGDRAERRPTRAGDGPMLDRRLADGRRELDGCCAGALTRQRHDRDLIDDDPALDGMGTTVCGVDVRRRRGSAVANIGDSRAYRSATACCTRLTHDHSWVQTLVDEGRITEAEALEHPHRSLILKVLNGQPQHEPDLELADVQAGRPAADLLRRAVRHGHRRRHRRARSAATDRDAAVAGPGRPGPRRRRPRQHHDHRGRRRGRRPAGRRRRCSARPRRRRSRRPPSTRRRCRVARRPGRRPPTAAPDAGRHRGGRALRAARRRRPARWVKLGRSACCCPCWSLAAAAWGWYALHPDPVLRRAPTTELVAIFRGVPDRLLGPAAVDALSRRDTTRVADLPPLLRASRSRATIRVDEPGRGPARPSGELRRERASSASPSARRRARADRDARPRRRPRPRPAPPAARARPAAATPGTTAGGRPAPAPSSTPASTPRSAD